MAAVLQNSSVRAGLVYQAVTLGQHLKQALEEAGVHVVLECQAHGMNEEVLIAAGLDVFVVNLDPELEDHLDQVADILDRFDCPVIYNDGATSSGLAGWDQARWARHLAAKIKGEIDSHPPRPSDAPKIPTPPKPVAAAVAQAITPIRKAAPEPVVSSKPAPLNAPPVAPAAEPMPAAMLSPQLPTTLEFERIDLSDLALPEFAVDDEHALADSKPGAVQFGSGGELEDGFGDFDPAAFDFPSEEVSNFRPRDTDELTDLDALLKQAAPRPDELKPAANAKADGEKKASDVTTKRIEPIRTPAAESAGKAKPESPRAAAELKAPPINWSLEPLENEPLLATGEAIFGKANYGAKEPTKPAVPPSVKPAAAAPAPAKVESAVDTELAGFDFFVEPEDLAPKAIVSTSFTPPVVTPAPTKPAEVFAKVASSDLVNEAGLGDLDALFADLDSVGIDTPASQNQPAATFDSDFDFDLDVDFDTAESAPPVKAPVLQQESSFADLDALFAEDEPAAANSQPVYAPSRLVEAPISQAARHVFVLGASIGGPEAVRTFLSKLKPSVPAAFVLAQHMGAEFLDLMATQLAKASVLPVKLAQHGELLQEGVVVVVPVNRRFEVDAAGIVQFGDLASESPYSPSIDQVLCDMADRFGTNCTAIIFSGMASDAVEGSKYLASRGAKVWVQDPATCVISSMIDGAQAAGVVSYVGAPEQLADHVLDELGVL